MNSYGAVWVQFLLKMLLRHEKKPDIKANIKP